MRQPVIRRPGLTALLAFVGAALPCTVARADAPYGARVLSVMERVADWQLAHLEPVASINWCDALFMTPPVWVQLSIATGRAQVSRGRPRRRAEVRAQEFAATKEYLYDADERLFYRDSTICTRRRAARARTADESQERAVDRDARQPGGLMSRKPCRKLTDGNSGVAKVLIHGGPRMSEPNLNLARDMTTGRARPREIPLVESIRDCVTPILTCTLIARSVCDDRRAQLALEIIERQMHRLTHLLKEAYGLDMRPRLD